MSLDIHTAAQTVVILALIAMGLLVLGGITSIRGARKLPFFRMRRERMLCGWRMLVWAVIMGIVAGLMTSQIEPLVYRFFPPTITPTLTPTKTLSPTASLSPTITTTPSITVTPLVSDTPLATPTPHVPLAIEIQFESTITPNPDAIFSQLTFTDGLDDQYRPLKPGTSFQNPIAHMYAVFSYDGMVVGSQWTALWYRNNELAHFETLPWNGGSGGLGYTDWAPEASEWTPGEYAVQIFTGLIFKTSGLFTVEGVPPTPRPSDTPTATLTPSRTPTPTRTPRPSITPTLTRTPRPTPEPYWSPTPTIKPSPYPTLTRTNTPIPTPLATRTPTLTPTPE